MKEIIAPVNRELIEKELTEDKLLRKTNYGNNELYVITQHNAPHTMTEIGRLRELTFRKAGGGTGKELDIDYFDKRDNPYKQLILWEPRKQEIIGGYRFFVCGNENIRDDLELATAKLFHFSDMFISDYLPHLIELGRSFIRPDYQSTAKTRKEMFALDNLWDGLGAIMLNHPSKKYFFGKVTIYQNYLAKARDMLLFFLEKYFSDPDKLLIPKEPIPYETDIHELEAIFEGKDYKEGYKTLSQKVRALGSRIPPLINAYMNLSPTLKTFGTGVNRAFGTVMETGIMVTMDDLYPTKIKRHINSLQDE